MATNGTNGKDNTMLYVLLAAVGLTLASVVPILLFGQGEGKANALIILGFITPIIGVLLLMLQSQQTAKIAAQGLVAAARAAAEAGAARTENAKTNVVLAGVEKKVDGMTERYTVAKVGEAAAVATVEATAVERDRGEAKAEELAAVTADVLAQAQAAPAVGSAATGTEVPAVPASDGALNVNVINQDPVEVDVVKPKPKEK